MTARPEPKPENDLPMSTRILVVEDELLVGTDLVMLLEDLGYRPDGPHPSVREALVAIENFDPEIAILDINLGGGETSLPIAEALAARDTPFVFLTGYSRLHASGNPLTEDAPRMKKPVSEGELKSVLERMIEQTRMPD
jgi:DNA-binding NtrC family response regulator